MMNNSKRKPGSLTEVLEVAWPLIVSTGSFTVMMFCDRLFLAWHSTTSIQAALPAGILSFTLVCGFMAVAAYTNTFVAQYHGAGQPSRCSAATAQGIFLSLLSIPFLILLIPVGRFILIKVGHSPAILEQELDYFSILMLGSFATPLSAAIGGFFNGRGKTRVTMYTNLWSNGINVILDYILIFGMGPVPAYGIKGAAWATVIAGIFSTLILLAFYLNRSNHQQFQTRSSFRWEKKLFWRMVRFGLPSGVHLALDICSFSIFVLLTGRISELALAVSNVALSINTLAFMPLIGLGISASVLVGRYQGAQQSDIAEKTGWTTLRIGLVYMLIVGSTFLLFPAAYFSLFTRHSDGGLDLATMLPLGRKLMIIMAVWGLADAVNLIVANALKGAGDTRFVMLFSIIAAWGVLVAGQFVLVELLQAGILASWCWTAFYIGVLATGYLVRFAMGRWKSIDVLERPPPIEPSRMGGEAFIVTD